MALLEGLHAKLVEDADVRAQLLGFLAEAGLPREEIGELFSTHIRRFVADEDDFQTVVLLDDPDRNLHVVQLGWTRLKREHVERIAAYGPFVEMGAGSGFVAHLLRHHGGEDFCHAFDTRHSEGTTTYLRSWEAWPWAAEVRNGSWDVLSDPAYSERALLLCWPDADSGFAAECLARYNGSTFVFVGEREGGCNGNSHFFGALARQWEEVASFSVNSSFEDVDDAVLVYRRRSPLLVAHTPGPAPAPAPAAAHRDAPGERGSDVPWMSRTS